MTTNSDSVNNELDLATMPDSMWEMKPWWCQPWSIVLTGITIPVGSWLLLRQWLVTLPAVAVIAGWWALFLWQVPAQYAAAVSAAKAK
ncbi:MAG: DUF6737 family protein [Cyanobacteria bacterium J06598_1]